MSKNVSRRQFILAAGAASTGLLAAACAGSAATPKAAPTSAPNAAANRALRLALRQHRRAVQKTARDRLERRVEAARREGQVVVQNPAGAGYRVAWTSSPRAYPGVEAVQQSFPDSATYIPKIRAEREAGIHSIDVIASTVIPVLQIMKPEGWIDPDPTATRSTGSARFERVVRRIREPAGRTPIKTWYSATASTSRRPRVHQHRAGQ